jgi:ATP-dependent Clp protease ATP-binding subunit ClpC
MELGKVRNRLADYGLKMVPPTVLQIFLVKKDRTSISARPLRRALEGFVEDPLSEEMLKGEFQGKGYDLLKSRK